MSEKALAAERYALLVEQLAEEQAHAHGWKTHVARTLGVHPSYISRVVKGDRTGIGGAVIARAIAALNIDPRFFTIRSRELGSAFRPHYHDYLLLTPVSADHARDVSRRIDPAGPRVDTNAFEMEVRIRRDWQTAATIARGAGSPPKVAGIAALTMFLQHASSLADLIEHADENPGDLVAYVEGMARMLGLHTVSGADIVAAYRALPKRGDT